MPRLWPVACTVGLMYGCPVGQKHFELSRADRYLWFAVAVAISMVWLFFELIAGYEIPQRAHPILGILVLAALIAGGNDLSKIARMRRILDPETPIPEADRRALADRARTLELEDPDLYFALLKTKEKKKEEPK